MKNNKDNYYKLIEVESNGSQKILGITNCRIDFKEKVTYLNELGQEITNPKGVVIERTEIRGVSTYKKIFVY